MQAPDVAGRAIARVHPAALFAIALPGDGRLSTRDASNAALSNESGFDQMINCLQRF